MPFFTPVITAVQGLASALPPVTLTLTPVLPKGKSVSFGMIGAAKYATASGGSSGGWQIVDRPGQEAITQWYDKSPKQITLDLIIDGSGTSIEPQCATVETWEEAVKGTRQTPVLAITGPVSRQATAKFWVVDDVSFDDDNAIRDTATGDRTQTPVSLTLLQFSPATSSVLTSLSPAKAAQVALAANGSSIGRRTYVVRAGDTLSSIAAAQMGDYTLWPQIAALNNIRDPRSVTALPRGRKIFLPS